MQVIYKNKYKERCSGRSDSMDFIVCVRKINRYLKEKYTRRFGSRHLGI